MEAVFNHHVEITPDVRNGRPHIVGTRLTVAESATMHLRMGLPLEEIAGRYDVDLASLYAAMAYYYDHRTEIDDGIAADEAFAEAFRRDNPSLLKSRLRVLQDA